MNRWQLKDKQKKEDKQYIFPQKQSEWSFGKLFYRMHRMHFILTSCWIQSWRTSKYKHRRMFAELFHFHFWVSLYGCLLCWSNWSGTESSFGVSVKSQHRTPLYLSRLFWGVASLNIHMALRGLHLRGGLPDQHLSNLCFPSEWALTYLRCSREDLLKGL